MDGPVRAPQRRVHLTTDDIARLQEAALELHAQPTLDAFRRSVPAAFLRMVPAMHFDVSVFAVDRRARRLRMQTCWASTSFISPELAARMERMLFEHPFTQHTLLHGYTGALILRELVPAAQLRRTALHRELLAPTGVRHLMGIITPGRRGITTFTYARTHGEPAFTPRERTLFELLVPHFEPAWRNLERRTGAHADDLWPIEKYGLTRRELELARWLARGKSNPEIAAILHIEVRTVEKHLERIYLKLGVENRTTAALLLFGSPGL